MTLAVTALVGTGCAGVAGEQKPATPSNVYRAAPQLPAQVHRVAVLPATAGLSDLATEAGRDALEPVFYAELRKRAVADIVIVSREELRNWTGKKEWTTAEPLPQDFFERLHKATDCDAVVFCRLTQFRAYPPLGVGWNLQLVDVQKRILWAVDEVFDAGDPAVADGARRYFARSSQASGPLLDANGILMSPRRFGQYAAATVLETLPSR